MVSLASVTMEKLHQGKQRPQSRSSKQVGQRCIASVPALHGDVSSGDSHKAAHLQTWPAMQGEAAVAAHRSCPRKRFFNEDDFTARRPSGTVKAGGGPLIEETKIDVNAKKNKGNIHYTCRNLYYTGKIRSLNLQGSDLLMK